MYVVVCQDLPARHQAVQACHACIAAGRDLIDGPNNDSGPSLVLLSIPTQAELISLSVILSKAGVAHRVFREEDLGGRVTALATEVIEQECGARLDWRRRLFSGMALHAA